MSPSDLDRNAYLAGLSAAAPLGAAVAIASFVAAWRSGMPMLGWPSFFASVLLATTLASLVAFPYGVWYGTRCSPRDAQLASSPAGVLGVAGLALGYAVSLGAFAFLAILAVDRAFVGFKFDALFGSLAAGIVASVLAFALAGRGVTRRAKDALALVTLFLFTGLTVSAMGNASLDWWKKSISFLSSEWSESRTLFSFVFFATGVVFLLVSGEVKRFLHGCVARGVISERAARRTMWTYLAIGALVTLIGAVPASGTDAQRLAHQVVGDVLGALLVFIVAFEYLTFPRLPKAFHVASVGVFLVDTLVLVLYMAGYLSLATMEIALFSLATLWLALLVRTLEVAPFDTGA